MADGITRDNSYTLQLGMFMLDIRKKILYWEGVAALEQGMEQGIGTEMSETLRPWRFSGLS